MSAPGHASWEALGSTVVLRVADPRALPPARAAVERELAAVDLACSRFRADSELSRVNASGGRPTRVSTLLCEAIELALRAAALTDGAVDPTVGTALVLAGYDRDWRLLEAPAGEPAHPPTVTARVMPGWRAVSLQRGIVTLPAGVSLDLGATAKAWAADRCATVAAASGGCGALVALGGDIALAGPTPAKHWSVLVTDDHRSGPDAPGQTVRVRSGGLATSSTAVRRWRHAGHTMHHVIDPATGLPVADTWRTASVAAASCADANIAATAAIVLAETAPSWLAERELPARLVRADGEVRTIAGWPEEAPVAVGALAA
jgi:thiamine biosynthesis lipoprotein